MAPFLSTKKLRYMSWPAASRLLPPLLERSEGPQFHQDHDLVKAQDDPLPLPPSRPDRSSSDEDDTVPELSTSGTDGKRLTIHPNRDISAFMQITQIAGNCADEIVHPFGLVRMSPPTVPETSAFSHARNDNDDHDLKRKELETDKLCAEGHVERTNDRDYEVEERRYRTLEGAVGRLSKESKGYLDALRAMTASQMRIAETIDAFYGDAGAKDGVSRSYKQAVEDLDAETIKALDGPFRTTVLDPVNRFTGYFNDINECIKKRNHKLLDYDSCRAKVKKLVEKPDKDVTKLPRAEREQDLAKQQYETLNEQLFTELPQLIDLRVPYLDPSFEALVKIQLRFCAEAYSRMAQVQQYLDADTREMYAQGHLDQRVEQVLGEIRDLSISGTV